MATSDTLFDRYLRSLTASWQGLAAGKAGALVTVDVCCIVARFPEPYLYLNNAVILAPGSVEDAASRYDDGQPHALWCLDDQPEIAAAIASAGYVQSETTRPMLRRLDDLSEPDGQVIVDADLDRFAEFIEIPATLLRGVPGLRAYASADYASGLVLQGSDDDVYVSMVYTLPTARRRGLATTVLTAALGDAHRRGARTATLQSTPMADSIYLRSGFTPLGRWQEWTRP